MRAAKLGGALVCALAWTWAEPVTACSRSACTSSGFFFPASGTAPANLPAISWWRVHNVASSGGDFMPGPDEVRLARVDGSTLEPIAFELETLDRTSGHYLIKPASAFVVGAQYVVWAEPSCGWTAPPTPPTEGLAHEAAVARFTISEPAALPSTLGTLTATEPQTGKLELAGGAACSYEQQSAYVDLSLELSAEALPWRDALFETTLVGESAYRPSSSLTKDPAPGRSWQGVDRDRIFAPCGDAEPGALDQGPHSALMQGAIPGTDLTLQSNRVQVELRCSQRSSLVDAGLEADTVQRSAAPARMQDAAAASDGGCRSVTTGGRSFPLAMLALLWALRPRRRRAPE